MYRGRADRRRLVGRPARFESRRRDVAERLAVSGWATVTAAPVPEPASPSMLGLLGDAGLRRQRINGP
jgi:hypothetical protein